ncbi:EPSP synthase-domain-containing protein [Entophlyctis helioformis]|nr:EPSP synthase-domain-containing protein [Entophlyctis helioformis]
MPSPESPAHTVPLHRVAILGHESIVVGSGLAAYVAHETVAAVPASAYIVVADENVARLHLQPLLAALRDALAAAGSPLAASARILSLVVPPGETHKTRETKGAIEDWLLASKCTRDSCLLALGGGVLGDLVGFVASTFMRGVPVIQIPTTLLAMVDSSIGGKTAIDTPHGKNLIGAFHQPRRIFIDIQYLTTLPRREFVNGLAEVIKTAAIWDESDFELLENYPEKVLGLVGAGSNQGTGLRGLLNFGHSVGHAIEAILFPALLHGECVAIGMIKEAEISRHLGHLSNVSVGRLLRCLQAYGLPVSLDDKLVKQRAPGKHCTVDRLLDIMRVDKKNQGDRKRMVLLAGIGKTVEPRASFVADNVIRKILSPAVRVSPASATPHAPADAGKGVSLAVPGSKSISNRALVMAALGSGECRLHGLLHSDDVQVMLDALQKLVGITYAWENDGETLVITGGGGRLRMPSDEIYLGNAGRCVLTGNARMKQRPIGPLVKALAANGCAVKYLESDGCLPIAISPLESGLPGGTIRLSASVSSQYVSSILISAPYAASPITLDLSGDAVVSQPYIDMTIAMMASFGINVHREPGTNIYRIPQGVYTNPAEYLVEADASSATYPLAFAAITGSTVTVTNIGSESMQGDALFAVKVLREMGCTVDQTATTTTVTGPATLRPLASIDMETMTDAFMTAVVLAAVARNPGDADANTTRITGIANQRVKECDRIAAMVEQLRPFGVTASELPDGIQVHGIDKSLLAHTAFEQGVKCFDDHRIAMSFSVLAAAISAGQRGAIITEKKCVEKTWPAWWDTLENVLGVALEGVDLDPHRDSGHAKDASQDATKTGGSGQQASFLDVRSESRPGADAIADTSILLVGMRGAGKTHMGRAAARALGRTFIDMDVHLEQTLGTTIPDLIKASGWPEFRRIEAEMLASVLGTHATGAVIASGGGFVETEAARQTVKAWSGLVVHVRRNMDHVEAYLGIDRTRPSFGEDIRAVWARRLPLYLDCSTAEFVIGDAIAGASPDAAAQYWSAVEASFVRFLRFKLRRTPPVVVDDPQSLSFFVSLTYPNVAHAAAFLDRVTEGANAIELRVDLLESTDAEFVGAQVAALRLLSPLPIVFTVRTQSQGGKFPDHRTDDMIALLGHGLRWGCEFVDVEFSAPFERFDALVKGKGNSLIIGSYHDPQGKAVWTDQAGSGLAAVLGSAGVSSGTTIAGTLTTAYLQQPLRMHQVYRDLHAHSDIVKLIGVARDIQDNFAVQAFRAAVAASADLAPKPLIALLMGPLGQLSRALNTFLTPVTHADIPTPAAPGQLSIAQIHSLRSAVGLLPRRQFHLFGSPIATSMSPMLHNTGFERLGLPHHYTLSETASWESVRDTVSAELVDGSFGGASVTIPLKVDVLRGGVATHITDAARAIGAINTLNVTADGAVGGDNTDWIGIQRVAQRLLAQQSVAGGSAASGRLVGVVLGAGGTARAACYALTTLPGVDSVRIWNRTHDKAVQLASEFGCTAVEALADVFRTNGQDNGTPSVRFVVVGTLPASAQDALGLDELFASSSSGGVVVEMAYRPRETKLLAAARRVLPSAADAGGAGPWVCGEGIDVLIEQGLEQFKIWTRLHAPAQAMRAAVYAHY